MSDKGPVYSGVLGENYLKIVKNQTPLHLHASINAGTKDDAGKIVFSLICFRFLL